MRPAALVGVIGLGLAACGGGGLPPEQVQAWVGRPATDLVQAWGAPTREVDDQGQRVLIYEEIEKNKSVTFANQVTTRQAGTVQAAAEQNAAARGPTVYARSYLFWVDAGGKIARTQIRHP
jgi:hypothetical protein